MTGPDHYREAQEILRLAKEARPDADREDIKMFLRFAELHIQCAQVAATIDTADQMPESNNEDWQAAIAGRPTPEPRRGPSFRDVAS